MLWCIFGLKIWNLVATFFSNFPENQLSKFRAFLSSGNSPERRQHNIPISLSVPYRKASSRARKTWPCRRTVAIRYFLHNGCVKRIIVEWTAWQSVDTQCVQGTRAWRLCIMLHRLQQQPTIIIVEYNTETPPSAAILQCIRKCSCNEEEMMVA